MNLLGPKIRAIRESQEITQSELAARCNVLGWDISRSTLAKIESQSRRLTDFEIVRFCAALDVKVEQLFENKTIS